MNLTATTYTKKSDNYIEVTPIYVKNYDFSVPISNSQNGWSIIFDKEKTSYKQFTDIPGISFFTHNQQDKNRYITQTITNMPKGFYKMEFMRLSYEVTDFTGDFGHVTLLPDSLNEQNTWFNFRINKNIIIDTITTQKLTDIHIPAEKESNKHNMINPVLLKRTNNDIELNLSGRTYYCPHIYYSDSIKEWFNNTNQYLVSVEFYLPEESNQLDISFGVSQKKNLTDTILYNHIGNIKLYYSVLPTVEFNS